MATIQAKWAIAIWIKFMTLFFVPIRSYFFHLLFSLSMSPSLSLSAFVPILSHSQESKRLCDHQHFKKLSKKKDNENMRYHIPIDRFKSNLVLHLRYSVYVYMLSWNHWSEEAKSQPKWLFYTSTQFFLFAMSTENFLSNTLVCIHTWATHCMEKLALAKLIVGIWMEQRPSDCRSFGFKCERESLAVVITHCEIPPI